MPGLCGILGKSPENLGGQLTAMLERMRHYPWYVQTAYVDPHAGLALGRMSLGIVNTGQQPVWNEDRSLMAVMEGEFFDETELRTSLQAPCHPGESQAALLLRGYEQEGRSFFKRLNGAFVAMIWDVNEERLLVVNDRFGMKPFYYAQLPGRLLLASEIKALLVDAGLSRELNRRGLAQFFTFGHLMGEDTLLESVSVLPAAACLTYDVRRDRLHVERYWRMGAATAAQNLSDAEHLERIDAAFKRAVDRRMAGNHRFGISLSGGLDARTILGVIDRGRMPLTSITMGMDGSIDHDSARRLAALSGCQHHAYVLDTKFLGDFAAHLQRMAWLTDGQYLSQCIVMPTLPTYRALGIEVLLRGHAGELMHMRKAYNFSLDANALALRDEAGLEAWLLRRMRAHIADNAAGSVFGPVLGEQLDVLARESLRTSLQQSAGVEPPVQRVSHVFLSERVRRETAMSMVKFGSLVETRLPYVDNDLVDALMSAPPTLKLDERIQAHVLRRRMPSFLGVVNANTGARLDAGPIRRKLAQARLKVFAKLGVRGYQPYERLGLWLRRELRPLVAASLLSDRCLERGIVDADRVRRLVQEHNQGHNHTFTIMALLVLEVGHRTFLDGMGNGEALSAEREAGALMEVS